MGTWQGWRAIDQHLGNSDPDPGQEVAFAIEELIFQNCQAVQQGCSFDLHRRFGRILGSANFLAAKTTGKM